MTDTANEPSSAVWTIPNIISMARIALIVVFVVMLISDRDGWAITALALAGVSDFLDGYLARKWNQVTKLGKVLDPTADRMLTLAVVLGLAVREIIPWWLLVVLFARDIVVGVALLYARSKKVHVPDVTRVGKWATGLLYCFLPLAYLAAVAWPDVEWLRVLALVGATFAAALYWMAGLGYVRDVRVRAAQQTADGDAAYTDTTEGSRR